MNGKQEYQILEEELGEWCGRPGETVVCSSGTAALHLALESLRLRPGSTVLVPDYAMVAVARAVTLAGHVVTPVDCDRTTLNINVRHAEDIFDRLAKNEDGHSLTARAILPVAVYGRPYDGDAVAELAIRRGLFIVEDLAEAHGVPPHPNAHASCWSFYRNKIIHGEEGGAVAFRDPVLSTRARQLRNLGFNEPHDYSHEPRGHNYRMANLLAAPIRGSLRSFLSGATTNTRRAVEGWYDAACPVEWRMPARPAPWVYDFRIPGITSQIQDRIVTDLRLNGFEARHGFKPIRTQREYRRIDSPRDWESDAASREVIYLPLDYSGPTWKMTPDRAKTAFDIVKQTLSTTR